MGDEPGNAVGQGRRFTGAGAGDYQQGGVAVGYGVALLGVESLEAVGGDGGRFFRRGDIRSGRVETLV